MVLHNTSKLLLLQHLTLLLHSKIRSRPTKQILPERSIAVYSKVLKYINYIMMSVVALSCPKGSLISFNI